MNTTGQDIDIKELVEKLHFKEKVERSLRLIKPAFKEHNNGKMPAIRDRRSFVLIYSEACLNRKDSFAWEKYLKTGMGKRYIKNRLKHFFSDRTL